MKKKELKKEIKRLTEENAKLKEIVKQDIFMNDSMMHNEFLDFMYQAHRVKDDLFYLMTYTCKENPTVKDRHENTSLFLRNITRRYEKIRGVTGIEKRLREMKALGLN